MGPSSTYTASLHLVLVMRSPSAAFSPRPRLPSIVIPPSHRRIARVLIGHLISDASRLFLPSLLLRRDAWHDSPRSDAYLRCLPSPASASPHQGLLVPSLESYCNLKITISNLYILTDLYTYHFPGASQPTRIGITPLSFLQAGKKMSLDGLRTPASKKSPQDIISR